MRQLLVMLLPVALLLAACGSDSYDSTPESLSTQERFAKIEDLAAEMTAAEPPPVNAPPPSE